ncbi:DUF5954 family protein [Micromonospora lupini]|uniref:DUF5954 family protein n=1 Tax=Micromonospora lupini TaxID=285679 RepID=UPI0033FB2E3C
MAVSSVNQVPIRCGQSRALSQVSAPLFGHTVQADRGWWQVHAVVFDTPQAARDDLAHHLMEQLDETTTPSLAAESTTALGVPGPSRPTDRDPVTPRANANAQVPADVYADGVAALACHPGRGHLMFFVGGALGAATCSALWQPLGCPLPLPSSRRCRRSRRLEHGRCCGRRPASRDLNGDRAECQAGTRRGPGSRTAIRGPANATQSFKPQSFAGFGAQDSFV